MLRNMFLNKKLCLFNPQNVSLLSNPYPNYVPSQQPLPQFIINKIGTDIVQQRTRAPSIEGLSAVSLDYTGTVGIDIVNIAGQSFAHSHT